MDHSIPFHFVYHNYQTLDGRWRPGNKSTYLLSSFLPITRPDTQTQEQSAQKYTPEHVGQFLKGIGLDHHVSVFTKENISGDILLEATDDMLEELGVTSATEKLKIKVHTCMGGGDGLCPAKNKKSKNNAGNCPLTHGALDFRYCSDRVYMVV